jgi:hypothetical protein
MSRFKDIDSKLENLSNNLNAKLTKDRPDYPEAVRTFEERRIDWIDNGINKAIIIQPNFEDKGVNSSIWNFINIAWFDDATSVKRPQWIKILVDKGKFESIQNNIDNLLLDSEKNLTKITFNDLT